MTAPTKAAKPGQFAASSGQLATFRLDGDLYGVEVEHVPEVLKSQGLTRVPLEGTDAVVIVVRLHGEAVSLLVDSIADVVDVDATDFEAPPDTLEGQAGEKIRGGDKLDGQLLLALDVQKAVSA